MVPLGQQRGLNAAAGSNQYGLDVRPQGAQRIGDRKRRHDMAACAATRDHDPHGAARPRPSGRRRPPDPMLIRIPAASIETSRLDRP